MWQYYQLPHHPTVAGDIPTRECRNSQASVVSPAVSKSFIVIAGTPWHWVYMGEIGQSWWRNWGQLMGRVNLSGFQKNAWVETVWIIRPEKCCPGTNPGHATASAAVCTWAPKPQSKIHTSSPICTTEGEFFQTPSCHPEQLRLKKISVVPHFLAVFQTKCSGLDFLYTQTWLVLAVVAEASRDWSYQLSPEKETLFLGWSWKASSVDASRNSEIMVSYVSRKDSTAILRGTNYPQLKITKLDIFLASFSVLM